jgi:hypothetical protein
LQEKEGKFGCDGLVRSSEFCPSTSFETGFLFLDNGVVYIIEKVHGLLAWIHAVQNDDSANQDEQNEEHILQRHLDV